ncbi:dephospho-CoA kinase [uncultured Thiothrix sp.]|jgi:dephospho-CoA kinase|uniref:dephospho-CoA kinase n=1 Tax=uncultured Thiothrix sp. TaxID=223185 RepID=UPI002607B5E0|nr:dephospho-CoA kinase [uncultured Thiothrix sp.]HMT94354.1 dephospho-CoA kinase [Thiolinea sp.]
MLKVGLTGGIGCGKSSAVAIFRSLGVPIVDADHIAREVVQKGESALTQLAAVFGAEAITVEGELDRAWMRAQIFKDPSARTQLEGILHPIIYARIGQAMQTAFESGAAYVIVDVPLLVEQGYQSLFDRIVVVDCLPLQQLERVRARDQTADSQTQQIMQIQASRDLRLQAATDLLDNTSSKEVLELQVNQLHKKFLGLSSC